MQACRFVPDSCLKKPAQHRTLHQSEPAHTPTCRTEKLASMPSELADALLAAPIGLVAGARIAPASAPPPAPAPGACAAALQTGRGHAPQIFHAAPSRAGARRFNHARAHIPGTGHNSRGGRPRLAHAAEPPGPLHFLGHFGKLPAFRERGLFIAL